MLTILDTDVVSGLRHPRRDPNLATWFAAQPAHDIGLASFTITEVEVGIARLPPTDPFTALLAEWLERIMATHRILPLDAEAARVLGRMHAIPALRGLGTTPPDAPWPRCGGDLIIAATAIAHGAQVATRNIRDFALVARHFPQLGGIDPFTGAEF